MDVTMNYSMMNQTMIDQLDGTFIPNMDPNDIMLKGYLLKDNWYGNKQRRFFELYNNGTI